MRKILLSLILLCGFNQVGFGADQKRDKWGEGIFNGGFKKGFLLAETKVTITKLDGEEITVKAKAIDNVLTLKQKISQKSPHLPKNQQIYSEDSEEELPYNTRLFPTVVNKKIQQTL